MDKEKLIKCAFFVLGMVSVIAVGFIVFYIFSAGVPGIMKVGFINFIFGKVWASTAQNPKFGILPLILSSLWGTFGALLIGVPVGIMCAVYIAQIAPPKLCAIFEETVNLIAGIPSVVFGLVGMMLLVPSVAKFFNLADGASLFCAILVLALMILPSVIKVSVASIRSVPAEYEEASLALGATKIETIFKVILPAAKSGIASSVVLGSGRAIGEAMAVMMVSGNVANMPQIFGSVRFLTTGVASEMSYAGGMQREVLFSIALVLFVFIMLINTVLNLCFKGKTK